MHEESRRLEVDVAAIRATVERLAVEQEHMRAEMLEFRRELLGAEGRIDGRIQGLEGRIDGRVQGLEGRIEGRFQSLESRLFQLQLAVFATLATTLGTLIANLVA